MSKKETTIQVTCPCCDAALTIDSDLPAVLRYKLPVKPYPVQQLKDATELLKQEATLRDEKFQSIKEAEQNKGKVLDRKFQDLLKKAKEEPITKPLKDIDLD